MKLFEETLSSEKIFDGRIINLSVDKVKLEDGTETVREVIYHLGGACVVALDENDNVFLVRQFRYPFRKVLTEVPAGKLEEGEEPEECARRELIEETGYEAENMVYLGPNLATPAYCEEVIHIFYADKLKKRKKNLDEGEFLESGKIPFEKAVEMVLSGEITDGKTVAGILKVKLLRDMGRL